jgi:hypothetical protein
MTEAASPLAEDLERLRAARGSMPDKESIDALELIVRLGEEALRRGNERTHLMFAEILTAILQAPTWALPTNLRYAAKTATEVLKEMAARKLERKR